jgi:RimJ/RimL family protein N-acetyltransferase
VNLYKPPEAQSNESQSSSRVLLWVPMPPTFRTLRETNLESFCANTADSTGLHSRLTGYIASGITRPEWCFIATDSGGEIVSRHYWWSRPGSDEPFGIDFVSIEDHSATVALVHDAREQLHVDMAFCQIFCLTEQGHNPSHIQADLASVLRDSGFVFEVARVTVQWTIATPIATDRNRLNFRPACDLDDTLINALFQSVTDGSLSHGMLSERARVGVVQEALERLQMVRSYRAERDWFAVGFNSENAPVGYVVPAYVGDTPIICEIGVAQPHRGNGYVDDLLFWATRRLAESGARVIQADTDRANTPMRAAFAKGGYREFRWRDDYEWRQPFLSDR